MKDSAWVRLIIMNIQYTMKNLSLILKKIFSKMSKTTRQRFTHSGSSGLEDALCVKRCLVVLAILENIFC